MTKERKMQIRLKGWYPKKEDINTDVLYLKSEDFNYTVKEHNLFNLECMEDEVLLGSSLWRTDYVNGVVDITAHNKIFYISRETKIALDAVLMLIKNTPNVPVMEVSKKEIFPIQADEQAFVYDYKKKPTLRLKPKVFYNGKPL